jgi:hypothetical protein
LDRPLGNVCTPRCHRRLGLTGNETLARQRGGLTPETPARFDDKPKKPSD